MGRQLALVAALAGSITPALVHAHGVMASDDDSGYGIWWLYAILGGFGGLILYRKWRGATETPERKAHKRHLVDLERALNSCLMQIQNADDYPKECGLTDEQRRDTMDSVTKIRRLIEDANSKLLS
jgi:hypothetical protein